MPSCEDSDSGVVDCYLCQARMMLRDPDQYSLTLEERDYLDDVLAMRVNCDERDIHLMWERSLIALDA